MASKKTTVLPIRVENSILARLNTLLEKIPGATRTSVAREALRRGLELLEAEHSSGVAPSSAPPSLPLFPQKKGEGLDTFAQRVLEAARSCQTGRYGDDRVFIRHVWNQYQKDHPGAGSFKQFKDRLVEANRARLLSLVRADMAPFLDQEDVKISEIRYRSATFHLICI